jgi:chromate transporter
MIETAAAARSPRSSAEIFVAFTRMALQGFGGVLPIVHRELVERQRWLTEREFVELLAIGQLLPGPNVINMGLMFGDRHFGWRGALAAVTGMMALPLAIVLVLATAYQQFASVPAVAGALRGMGAVAAGLVVTTAIKLASTLRTSAIGRPASWVLAGLAFATVGLLRWPMVWVVLGLGALAMAWAWYGLARRTTP